MRMNESENKSALSIIIKFIVFIKCTVEEQLYTTNQNIS